MKYYSLKQIIDSLPKSKNSKDSLWVRLFIRKISFLFTYIFINLGFSAWEASIFSIFIAIIGCVFLSINNYIFMIIGVVLINLWLIFDCVDGNIARVKKTSSSMGEFIDAISGYFISAFIYFSAGVSAYNTTILFSYYSIYFIILGAIASISGILIRLIFQKYINSKEVKEDNKKTEKNIISYLKNRLDKELGISGLVMPFLIIALIFRLFDVFTLFYFAFNLVILIAMTIYYSIKAKREGKSNKKYKIGYTTGVFDMFHIGHLNILKKAKEYCDYLIVGVTTDDLCYQRKNKMPIIPFEQRVDIVKAVKYVDKVVPQTNMDKISTHSILNYDVVFVGSDWKGTDAWNQYEKQFKEINVDVIYLPYTEGISSTLLGEKRQCQD